MYEDGTGKTQALPTGVFGFPSSKVYDGSRWWLTLLDAAGDGHGEIFAFRDDGSPPVQLTSCSPGGVFPGGWFGTSPNWSNDQQDSFVTIDAAADRGMGRIDDEDAQGRAPAVTGQSLR